MVPPGTFNVLTADLTKMFQPEVGKISAQNPIRKLEGFQKIFPKVISENIECSFDKTADVLLQKSQEF